MIKIIEIIQYLSFYDRFGKAGNQEIPGVKHRPTLAMEYKIKKGKG